MAEIAVLTENLSKTYGWLLWKKSTPSLTKLNLSIPKGVVFGFLGPNGAGKTTTIRLLMDLIRPSEGRAFILGKPVGDHKVKERIGFLPDCPAFSAYLTANEFLNICAKLLRIPSGERKGRIAEVLEIVNMTEHARSKLGGFSRGMTQRIGIAQAILNRPELLILDEPLIGLDPLGRQELKNIMINQKKRGTNVFFSSHILSDVEKICDYVGILNRGNLLCYGTLDELLSATGYRVKIRPGKDDIVKDLMTDAISSSKLPDGGWELVFNSGPQVDQKINQVKAAQPEAIDVSSSKENLEDFFFRKIGITKKSE